MLESICHTPNLLQSFIQNGVLVSIFDQFSHSNINLKITQEAFSHLLWVHLMTFLVKLEHRVSWILFTSFESWVFLMFPALSSNVRNLKTLMKDFHKWHSNLTNIHSQIHRLAFKKGLHSWIDSSCWSSFYSFLMKKLETQFFRSKIVLKNDDI